LVCYPKKGDETLDRSDSTQKAVQAARTAIDKKATDTIVLDLKDRSTITDYFVICSGENPAQIRAISEAIEKKFAEFRIFPLGIEGLDFCRWVLMDYDDVIVHIFSREARAYYEIERLWKDAQRIEP
jgi:ribosome-associated protein